uniref:RING-type domain-containing protein n=1 Tax=Oryzias melastigma TaxID=30732 RepID=A0A3B3DE12_ORYME
NAPQGKEDGQPPQSSREDGGEALLECPSCRGFLGEPVTIACGHSYCKRCLHRRLLSKCKLCCEAVSGKEKVNVTLCGLVEKYPADQFQRFLNHVKIPLLVFSFHV